MSSGRFLAEVDEGALSVLRIRKDDAPRLVFAHANGFNASTYRQFLEPLAEHFEIIAPDLRGHGLSTAPADPARLHDWHIFARDLTTLAGSLDRRPTMFVGHSMGSICGLLAIAHHGLAVDRIAMIEPVVMPSWFYAIPHIPGGRWAYQFNPMSSGARARRSQWPSREDVLARYRDKSLFSRWVPGALEDYLETGVHENGEGVSLSCSPHWEAAIFASHGHNPWRALRRIDQTISVLKSRRKTSTVYPLWRLKRFDIALTETDAGHLAPMEVPEDCARWTLAQAGDLL